MPSKRDRVRNLSAHRLLTRRQLCVMRSGMREMAAIPAYIRNHDDLFTPLGPGGPRICDVQRHQFCRARRIKLDRDRTDPRAPVSCPTGAGHGRCTVGVAVRIAAGMENLLAQPG